MQRVTRGNGLSDRRSISDQLDANLAFRRSNPESRAASTRRRGADRANTGNVSSGSLRNMPQTIRERAVQIPPTGLAGDLIVPARAKGVIIFAHGSGSSRHSPRNRHVAREMPDGGFGTLLLDLLTNAEEEVDLRTRHLRFDI